MTLGAPASLGGQNGSDLSVYTTGSQVFTNLRRYVVYVFNGKASNLSQAPSSLTCSVAGITPALVKQVNIVNNNLSLSAWTFVGNGGTGTLTITFPVAMDTCSWQVVNFPVVGGTDTATIRQSVTGTAAATGLQGPSLVSAPLSTSYTVCAQIVNNGAASLAGDSGLTNISAAASSPSGPANQYAIVYDGTAPITDTPRLTATSASGRASITIEIGDVVTPPVVTSPFTEYNGTAEVALTAYWYDGSTEVLLTPEYSA